MGHIDTEPGRAFRTGCDPMIVRSSDFGIQLNLTESSGWFGSTAAVVTINANLCFGAVLTETSEWFGSTVAFVTVNT